MTTTTSTTQPADEQVVIRVRELRKTFEDAEGNRAVVLDSITLDILRGETVVIMGGSGCGKSTLLNCLIGEYDVDAGEIGYLLRGMNRRIDIAHGTPQELDDIRKRFGILFQSGALYNSLTVEENLALPIREHTSIDDDVIEMVVAMKLQQVRMLEHRDKMPSQLSGGQKKRVGLARATALDPEILFYDEPSAGLDPVTSTAIDRLIMDLSGKLKVTSIVVTHEMDSAFRIADRMVMLDMGRVIKVGPREDFERLRDSDPAELATAELQRIRQFLNGTDDGPLTGDDGISEFERLLVSRSTHQTGI